MVCNVLSIWDKFGSDNFDRLKSAKDGYGKAFQAGARLVWEDLIEGIYHLLIEDTNCSFVSSFNNFLFSSPWITCQISLCWWSQDDINILTL